MFVRTVALLFVAQCAWGGPSPIRQACNISCIRADDFVCLEQALLNGNKTNLKNLRSAIFQPNMPIPRCVAIPHVQNYLHHRPTQSICAATHKWNH